MNHLGLKDEFKFKFLW